MFLGDPRVRAKQIREWDLRTERQGARSLDVSVACDVTVDETLSPCEPYEAPPAPKRSDDEVTLHEIGVEFGVTRERIRQIERDAIAKLKKRMKKRMKLTEAEKRAGLSWSDVFL